MIDYDEMMNTLKVECPVCKQEGLLITEFTRQAPRWATHSPYITNGGEVDWDFEMLHDPDLDEQYVYAEVCGCHISVDAFEDAANSAIASAVEGLADATDR